MTQTPIMFTGPNMLETVNDLNPVAVLTIYKHAMLLKKFTDRGVVEFPVDPAALAKTIGQQQSLKTGLLTPDVLHIAEQGDQRTVVAYRHPQLTAIWVHGVEDPYRIPMPGLVMVRHMRRTSANYRIYAVKRRPMGLDEPLYNAPFPNVSGGTCWGTVRRPGKDELHSNDLTPDWDAWFGSKFGTHSCKRKSKQFPDDIRQLYPTLVGHKKYPLKDLVKAERHLKIGDLLV